MSAPVRGCGTRVSSGIYAECSLSPNGKPIEEFLIDPPTPVDPGTMGISALGVKQVLEPNTGVWHIVDWVGSNYYPSIPSFIEEARRFGISRRFPRTLDYSKVTPASRLVLLHSSACIDQFGALMLQQERIGGQAMGYRWKMCPCGRDEHSEPGYKGMCAGLWWENEYPYDEPDTQARNSRIGIYKKPSFNYRAAIAPVQCAVALGIFAIFPLTRLVVVKHDDPRVTDDAMERLAKAGVPSAVVEE